jgi:hypothetical protein
LIFFSMMVTFFFLTQYFQIVQGKSAFTAGLYILPVAGMMMVGAPTAGLLSSRVGPRVLVAAAGVAVVFGMAWLSQIEANTSYPIIAVGLLSFGFGGGMALTPLTDTVMAAVPVNDAGIGSAINDVSRELGAALGIAIVGSLVSNLYRSDVESGLQGVVPDAFAETAGEGIGVATVAAQSLPAEAAAAVLEIANTAFIDAFTTGLLITAAVMALATVVALTLLPSRMRTNQADDQLEGPARQVEFERTTVGGGAAAVPAAIRSNDAA